MLLEIPVLNASEGSTALANFTKKFKEEISQDYGFYLFGSGVSFPKKIKYISISFQSHDCENIAGARKLAIKITKKMIERMNQDVNLLKYLSSNPACLEHVDLTIGFREPNNTRTPGVLDSVMVIGSRNKVVYNTNDKTLTKLIDLHEETFDEAERIVASSNVNDLPAGNK